MRFLRKILRLTILPFWFMIIAFLALPGMFAGRKGIRRNGKITRLWGAGVARILNIQIERNGKNPEAFLHGLIVSNHQSYLDILVNSAVFPVRFLPKVEIRYWPVLGWFIALNRPVWVNRKSPLASAKVAEEIEKSVCGGLPILVFPEGTNSDGSGLLPFKSTAFEAVAHIQRVEKPVIANQPEGWCGNPLTF